MLDANDMANIDQQPIDSLRCLGQVSKRMLAEADINNVGQLKELGAAEAYLRVSFFNHKKISLNLLYAMHAGLLDMSWPAISKDMREKWREELEIIKDGDNE